MRADTLYSIAGDLIDPCWYSSDRPEHIVREAFDDALDEETQDWVRMMVEHEG